MGFLYVFSVLELFGLMCLFCPLQSTSGGEPRTLLNALRPMLGSLGDIRTPQEVVRVIRYFYAPMLRAINFPTGKVVSWQILPKS